MKTLPRTWKIGENSKKHKLPGAKDPKTTKKNLKKYIIHIYPLCKLVTPLETVASLRLT